MVVTVLDPPPREGCELGSSAEPLPEEGLKFVNSTFQLWQPSVSFSAFLKGLPVGLCLKCEAVIPHEKSWFSAVIVTAGRAAAG